MSCVHLHPYGAQALSVVEEATVKVTYLSQQFFERVVVIKGDGLPLFGRNWLTKVRLDWQRLCAVRVNDVVAEFPSVFSDGLGTIQGHTTSITSGLPSTTMQRSTPSFVHHARQSGGRTHKIEGGGIIRPVRLAEWASPIVVVRK